MPEDKVIIFKFHTLSCQVTRVSGICIVTTKLMNDWSMGLQVQEENSNMKILSNLMLCLSGSRFPIDRKIEWQSFFMCFSTYFAPVLDILVLKWLFNEQVHLHCSFLSSYIGNCLNINFRSEGAQLNLVKFWNITQPNKNIT